MMKWRAWYANGARLSSADMPWSALPALGLVGAVVYMDPPYRRIRDGHDWIWPEGDDLAIVKGDTWGSWADPPEGVPIELLKRGAGMPDDAWAAVQREMMEAKEAP